ncbi:MAG: hypothetical protein ACYSR9_03805 [Planctomycetota bacterium]|jgi:hypothetical protein
METIFEFIKTNANTISVIATITVAIVSGTFAVLKILAKKKFDQSDLSFSDLSNPDSKRLTALDGMSPIVDTKNDRIVFPQGCNMDLELSHNGRGSDSVTVRRIEVEVQAYEPGDKPEYASKIEGANIFGAGTATDHRFHVSVFGKEVGLASWIIDAKTHKVEQAKNQDLLSAEAINKEGHRLFYFDADTKKSESLRGTLLAKTPGLYQIHLHFYISIGSKDHDYSTKPIFIYAQ